MLSLSVAAAITLETFAANTLVTSSKLPTQATVERGSPLPRKTSFGVGVANLTPEEMQAMNLASKLESGGVRVVSVAPSASAEKLGLKVGDIFLELNGSPVRTREDVLRFVVGKATGDPLDVKILRDGKPQTLKGKFQEKPRQKPDGFEVKYDQVLSKGKRIRVIFTHPTTPGPHPAVFLIGGIGAFTIDSDFATMPYGFIFNPLAKGRYATIRVDKPGMGDSEGPSQYTDLLFDDELDAYLQAMRLAKTMPFIDKNRIAIFGHSMGGSFGPLVAAEEKIAAVAVNGTVTKTWMEYVLENTRRQELLQGASPGQVDESLREVTPLLSAVFGEGLSIEQAVARNPKLATAAQTTFPDGKTYSGVNIKFFQQLATKNLAAAWEKANVKVLSTWGENDFISTGYDHEFLAKMLNEKYPGSATFVKLTNSDHGFKQTESFKDSAMKWGKPGIKENMNILSTLTNWLDEVLR